MANSHPGSYCGQDAYNDMFVTERKDVVCRERTAAPSPDKQQGRSVELYARSTDTSTERIWGGTEDMANAVRRLTPLECERLQGFPDGWTNLGEWTDSNGKVHKESDSARYKALGNSIALPFWQYLARRICAQYERDITMGSLFDGIGGFPLVFQRCGATPVWASEIEEFCIAVTKKHFPEEEVTHES